MSKLLQTLMDGTAVGSLYALIALGYTMVYGVLQFINFAHGDVFMLGAWFSLVCARAAAAGATGEAYPPPVRWATGGLAIWAGGLALLAGVAVWLAGKKRANWPGACGAVEGAARPIAYVGGGVAVTVGLLFAGSWICYRLAPTQARWEPTFGAASLTILLTVLLVTMAGCGVVGFIIERVAYRPLRAAPRLNVLITAIGVSLLLENLCQLPGVFGTESQPMPALLPDVVLATVQGVQLHLVDAVVILFALLLMAALEQLVHRTRMGLAMRATSFDPGTAALMGVPVDRVISFTFIVGSVLAGAAGLLYASKYGSLKQSAHVTWMLLGLKAFVAAVVGGIGNIRGAMLGGLLIGLIEFFGTAYLSSSLRDVYVFSLLILVLLVRPTGVLGRAAIEKV